VLAITAARAWQIRRRPDVKAFAANSCNFKVQLVTPLRPADARLVSNALRRAEAESAFSQARKKKATRGGFGYVMD
jgi:hypothetical protein